MRRLHEGLDVLEDEVLAVARQGAALGCTEALFTLGDRPEDRWPAAAAWLEEQGYDSEKLAAGLQDIQEKGLGIDSLLIVHNGYVVLDAHFAPYDGTFPHNQASVTKSVMTTLIGIAADQGKLSLDDPMVSFFPDRTIANLDADPIRAAAAAAGLNALYYVPIPEPPNLNQILNAGPAARTAAIQLGKALFCEKPLSFDLAETDEVLRTVDAAGVVFQVGFNRRFDQGHAAVREAVAQGEIGRLSREGDAPETVSSRSAVASVSGAAPPSRLRSSVRTAGLSGTIARCGGSMPICRCSASRRTTCTPGRSRNLRGIASPMPGASHNDAPARGAPPQLRRPGERRRRHSPRGCRRRCTSRRASQLLTSVRI